MQGRPGIVVLERNPESTPVQRRDAIFALSHDYDDKLYRLYGNMKRLEDKHV